jgi:uncharacterized protein (TIGR03083 family)
MGLNHHDAHYDDLAAFAIDALDGDEALTVEALLADDPAAATYEAVMRRTAGELVDAAGTALEVEAPIDLRARIIRDAHARRAPVEVEAVSTVDVHRIELERFEMLLRRLTPEQWRSGVQPKEFEGWTIHDLAAHITSNEALFAQLLDATVEGFDIPETQNVNVERTMAAIARHRLLDPSETIAELHACAAATDAAVRDLAADELERDLSWWGNDMRILTVLTVRSFETWTHADDIRRAIGLAQLPPPAPSLKTMSTLAAGWTGLMVLASGHDHQGRSVRLDLTGPGGGSHHVDLTLEARDLTGIEPDAVITLDIVDYCRAIGDRFLTGPVAFQATGDVELARDVVSSLNALATL